MSISKIVRDYINKGFKRVSGKVDTGLSGFDELTTGPGPSTLMVFKNVGEKVLLDSGKSTWTPSNQTRVIKSDISSATLPGPRSVEILVIAGGGAPRSTSGGGPGGVKYYGPTPTPVRVSPTYTIPTSTAIPVVVGAGGTGGNYNTATTPPYDQVGSSGLLSKFDTIISTGGGGGSMPGGSGGGGGQWPFEGVPYPTYPLPGASGIPGQGNSGGSAVRNPAPTYGGGGGGGATGPGGNPNPNSGPGGTGVQLPQFNPFGVPAPPGNNWFAGGGGGTSTPSVFGAPQQGVGGWGGGGPGGTPGGPNASVAGGAGATNTGAAGGAAHGSAGPYGSPGNAGGPGIIIIRY